MARLKSCPDTKHDLALCTGNEGWVPHAPDFLWGFLALMKFMRLSSMKAAHAAVAGCHVQEIRVKPFFGLSGIMPRDQEFLSRM
jgi:hypothetical protein